MLWLDIKLLCFRKVLCLPYYMEIFCPYIFVGGQINWPLVLILIGNPFVAKFVEFGEEFFAGFCK